MLNLAKGYKIYEPERLKEEYEVTNDVTLMANVDVEKIKEVFHGRPFLSIIQKHGNYGKPCIRLNTQSVHQEIHGCKNGLSGKKMPVKQIKTENKYNTCRAVVRSQDFCQNHSCQKNEKRT